MKNFKTAFLSALTLCLFLFLTIRCGLYAEQSRALTAENEALSTDLSDKEQALTANKQTIREKTQEIEDLQAQLAEAASGEEAETEREFLKKDVVYLIDTKDQLWDVERYINQDMEIEPGVPAVSASYRLRADVVFYPYQSVCLGTEENPFCGSFDGDGHLVDGAFEQMDGASVPEAMFFADKSAKIENLHVINRMYHYFPLSEPRECDELDSHLPNCESSRIQAEVSSWGLDVQKTAQALRTHWERNAQKEGAYVSMTFYPKEKEAPADADAYIQKVHTALCTLAGAEYTQMIEEAMTKEEGYLWFVRLENVGGLTCCSFEIGEPTSYLPVQEDNVCNYYIITDGSREGKPVPSRCFTVPYTYSETHIGRNLLYYLEQVDVNFDGEQDLLIHEGHSSGSGGSWGHYRALVWNDADGQFAYFPSFPKMASSLEFDQKRIVEFGQMGISYEYVIVYGIVDGEYQPTRELICQTNADGVTELLYYEMGELVETHRLSDEDNKEDFYPDMNYWLKG